jgi:membrane protein implicated in regulation of membrane protease activity
MVGGEAEARSTIDPTGKAFMRGTLWSARLAEGVGPIAFGDRVTVEEVDGLTLVVRPATPAQQSQTSNKIKGAS